jgi:serine/threonine protein kinase
MSSLDENAEVKLSDFGLSTMTGVDANALMRTKCGTLMYCAPEVLCGEQYGKAVDMWSTGVITYVLLCGYPPFYDNDDSVILQLVLEAKYECEFVSLTRSFIS